MVGSVLSTIHQSNDDYLTSNSISQKYGANIIVYLNQNIYVAGSVADSSYTVGVKSTVMSINWDDDMTLNWAQSIEPSDRSQNHFYRIDTIL